MVLLTHNVVLLFFTGSGKFEFLNTFGLFLNLNSPKLNYLHRFTVISSTRRSVQRDQ
jgi:hypothetical protein